MVKNNLTIIYDKMCKDWMFIFLQDDGCELIYVYDPEEKKFYFDNFNIKNYLKENPDEFLIF